MNTNSNSVISVSDSSVLAKLSSLNGTQNSIQNTSQFILNHNGDPKRVAKLWYKQYKSAGIKQKVVLLYLANDVIQNGRKKCPAYLKLFQGALPSAFNDAAKQGDSKVLQTLHRLLSIWQERNIYPKEFLLSIRRTVSKYGDDKASTSVVGKDASTSKNGSSSRPAGGGGSSGSKHRGHHHHRHRRRSPKSPKAENDPALTLTVPNTSSTINTTKMDSPTSSKRSGGSAAGSDVSGHSQNPHVQMFRAKLEMEFQKDRVKPPATMELLTTFEELQSPPSADALVRETIAKFPTEVSSLNNAHKVKSKREASAYLDLVRESTRIVHDYNQRLEKEIQQRKHLGTLLHSYLLQQRDLIQDASHKLAECSHKLDKVTLLKDKCFSHVNNLPDLPSLVFRTDELTPLPTVNDLFD